MEELEPKQDSTTRCTQLIAAQSSRPSKRGFYVLSRCRPASDMHEFHQSCRTSTGSRHTECQWHCAIKGPPMKWFSERQVRKKEKKSLTTVLFNSQSSWQNRREVSADHLVTELKKEQKSCGDNKCNTLHRPDTFHASGYFLSCTCFPLLVVATASFHRSRVHLTYLHGPRYCYFRKFGSPRKHAIEKEHIRTFRSLFFLLNLYKWGLYYDELMPYHHKFYKDGIRTFR